MKTSTVTPIRRLIAYVIDWYLATIVSGIPLMLVNSMKSGSASINTSIPDGMEGWIWGIISICLGIFYYWLLPMIMNGSTPGKKLMHFRIVSKKTGELPSIGSLFLRQVVGILFLEGAIAFPSQLLRELLTRLISENTVSMLQTAMVIITVISISFGLYSPSRQMIHDIIGNTVEVMNE